MQIAHAPSRFSGTNKHHDGISDYPFIQKYLEYVTEDDKAPQAYFTRLGMILIQKCVHIHDDPDTTLKDKGKIDKAKKELYNFLEKKSHYK